MTDMLQQASPRALPSATLAPARLAPAPPARPSWESTEGAPLPLGVTWVPDERACNFALYSKHAERVTLLLYAAHDVERPALAVPLDFRRHKSGRVWHCRLPEDALRDVAYYAYSVDGPAPAGRRERHAFDPDKVLLDPYARSVHFPPRFDREAAARPGSNAGRAPLGVLDGHRRAEAAPVRHLRHHESDALVYELHVRHFTRHESSGVEPARRGTYAGVIDKIPYLVALGVTVVELMPVFERDPRHPDQWGYMPLAFMAAHRGYASGDDERAEFRAMVDALHRAGIEVVLDVVYNHTSEGGATGPTYGMKGIDNSTYYLMTDDPAKPWADYAGTGNTLHCANHAVRKLVIDSMHHWVLEMGVDGFRFDLASIFARGSDGHIEPRAPLVGEISGEHDLAGLRLIAEPWDVGGANQLGRAFPGIGWQQWNGCFRDDVRRFVRGDPGTVPALMRRLYGSDDLFPDDRAHACHPAQSVNYVTCHDGPTLYDLVAYNHKHNWANGHGNTDGPAERHAWNCGWEGDEHVPDDVLRLRRRQAKNLVLLTLLANGTPMLRAGDEFLHTQHGNDNPYNQDDERVWLDWRRQDAHAGHLRFVREAIAFRRRHPSLCRSRFWRDDVRWHGVGALPDLGYDSHSLAYCLLGASEGDDDLYVMANAWQEPLTFEVQEGAAGDWRVAIDTGREAPDDIVDDGDGAVAAMRHVVEPHSIVVLVRRR
jgi:isoamylase